MRRDIICEPQNSVKFSDYEVIDYSSHWSGRLRELTSYPKLIGCSSSRNNTVKFSDCLWHKVLHRRCARRKHPYSFASKTSSSDPFSVLHSLAGNHVAIDVLVLNDDVLFDLIADSRDGKIRVY